jgi:putative transposase
MPSTTGGLWRWYHNVSECHYHVQLTVKYRKVLIDKEVEQIMLETWKGFNERYAINIYTVGFDGNHVHILCQFLPKYSGGQVIKWIKSLTAKRVLKLPQVKKELWGGEFWTDGYYIATISNRGTKHVIENYVKRQGNKPDQLQLFNL